MKQLGRKFVVFFMAAVMLLLGTRDTAWAKEPLSEELTKEIYGEAMEGRPDDFVAYNCGTSTEDGALEVRSNSNSLKEGDTVEIDLIYHADKSIFQTKQGLSAIETYFTYNFSELEYIGTTIKEEHQSKYAARITDSLAYTYEKRYERDLVIFYSTMDFNISDTVATIQFKVLKDLPSAMISFEGMALTGPDTPSATTYYYYDDDTDSNQWEDVLLLNITDTDEQTSSLELASAPAQGSDMITVPINIAKNDGFNLLGVTIDYDTSFFTYDSLEIDDALKSKISLDSAYESPGSGRVKASFISLEDITDTGDFLRLKLKVKDGTPSGTTSNVAVNIAQVGNVAETSMSGTGATSAVTVTAGSGEDDGDTQEPALGDVNADKSIDLVDAVYILQNYNQVREFTSAQQTAADVDKNNEVNLVDALMIMKYFNGELTGF